MPNWVWLRNFAWHSHIIVIDPSTGNGLWAWALYTFFPFTLFSLARVLGDAYIQWHIFKSCRKMTNTPFLKRILGETSEYVEPIMAKFSTVSEYC